MTGLARSTTKFVRKVQPKELRKALPKEDLTRQTEKAVLKTHFGPRIPNADDSPVIPLPDEEELEKSRRKRRSRRAGGRVSTVLSGSESGGDVGTYG